ncbi:MAG TPA: hypothetical protein VLT58_06785, partial [Polyangia bacterium]|nr:hypothetical protein [Polyangia bacterium]
GAAGRPDERYDADDVQSRVAARYRELAAATPKTVVLDASGSIDQVTADIVGQVDRLITL